MPPMFGPPMIRDPFQNPESAPPLPPETPDPGVDPGSSTAERPSPASTDLSKRKLTLKVCKEVLGGVLGATSGLLNARLAVDDDDQTWIMGREEIALISVPVARIIARRVPAIPEGDTSTSDVLDGVTAVVGLFEYGLRCFRERAERKIARRRDMPRAYVIPDDELEPEPDTAPAASPMYGVPFVPRQPGPIVPL